MNPINSALQHETTPESVAASVIWLTGMNGIDREAVGGKAAQLAALLAAGFPVPAGFCLTTTAYRHWVASSPQLDLAGLLEAGRFREIYARILQLELDHSFVVTLFETYRQLQARHPGPVAVRSSSTAEDLDQNSFAGLYETVLDVSNEPSLLDAIRRCWASYWSEEAVRYREQFGLPHTQHGMAVVVQAMIRSRYAGVLFTGNPLDGQRELVIEFVEGSAESLVSGDSRAERLLVDRETRQVRSALRSDIGIDVSSLEKLVALGLAIEQHLAAPQDIEWAMDSAGEIWVLQSRPVTTGLEEDDVRSPDVPPDWPATYDEPFSPLGCDIAIRRYDYWVRAINAYLKTRFEPQMRNIDGLLYYKPAWRSPGPALAAWTWFWRLARWVNAARIYRHYVETVLPDYRRRLAELQQHNPTQLDTATLIANFNAAVEVYLDFQYTSYPIGSVATLSAHLLDRVCRLWFGRNGPNALDLLSGLDDLSIRRELAIQRLGESLREALPEDKLAELDYSGLLALAKEEGTGRRFWEELHNFLDEYGYVWADRYPRDPAWELNKDALMASLLTAADRSSGTSLNMRHEQLKARRRQAIDTAERILATRGRFQWRLPVFRYLLRRAERFFPHKENRNHYVYQAAMIIRGYAQEIGRRLHAEQLLLAEDDVFFLTLEEIEGLLRRGQSATELRTEVSRRKETYRRSRRQAQRRKVRRALPHPPAHDGTTTAIVLNGDACSPGLAAGPARLISGLGELQRVRRGEILVCTQLRPAWAAVFARAGGVVVEMGSLLSHGSTLAREYGIPAVINIEGITQLVREGDWLTVDGEQGRVIIEEGPSTAREEHRCRADSQPG